MSPDHDPKPLNFDRPVRDCPFCGERLPCSCTATQMFGEDFDVQSRHYHREFTVNPRISMWYGWHGETQNPDTPDDSEDGE